MMKTIQNQWLFLYQSFLHANQTTMNPRDELVLIVDNDNNETGSAPRHKMRAGGLPHRACYILVFNSRGELFVQTDVDFRAAAYSEVLNSAPALAPSEGDGYIKDNPYGAQSSRERRCVELGMPVFRLLFQRRAAVG